MTTRLLTALLALGLIGPAGRVSAEPGRYLTGARSFVAGSSTSWVNCGSPSDTTQLTTETRIVWARFTVAPTGNRPFLLQSGGGINANWIATSSSTVNGFRDFSTTDAGSTATFAALNIVIGQPWFGALTMSAANAIRLYGGTLTIPATEASSYTATTTGVGTPVSVAGKSVQIGGFSGLGQGFSGVIWMAAWFDWEMSLAELRDVQMHPERWLRRSLHAWYVGNDGPDTVKDLSGHGATCTTSNSSLANEYLPRVVGFRRPS